MNATMLRVSVIAMAAAMIALTGCKSHKKNSGNVGGIDDGAMITAIEDADTGLALTGEPFDLNHERATDVSVQPIYFGYDSFQLPPAEIAKIQQAASVLEQNPSYVLIVEGHCDERGSNEYNLSLGEQRALAVRNYIVTLGISADRIQSRSFGEERPAVAGTGEDAWSLNRRGEFAFYK